MKKVKFEGKLNLNKETVTTLADSEMKQIMGGVTATECSTQNGAYTCNCHTNQNTVYDCCPAVTQGSEWSCVNC